MKRYSDAKIRAHLHTADKAQKWCKKNFKLFISKEKRTPKTVELNSLDYSTWDNIMWNIIKSMINDEESRH